jgi:uncharacterized hydrophobic protein (TIGR00341 family)
MPARLIEVVAGDGQVGTLAAIAEHFKALSFRVEPSAPDGSRCCRILARVEKQQDLVDQIQGALGQDTQWRITISPIEATIPEPEPLEGAPQSPEQATREELYAEIAQGARIDVDFVLLVVASTVVAAIGLIENNVAVVIAAMLIAPLLGPNVAMAFGSILGDRELLARGALASLAGTSISVLAAAAIGLGFPGRAISGELLLQTSLGYSDMLLALAAGAAGALSLTTRLPAALTGVMVAVALLPPATALGYTLGLGEFGLAAGAAALVAANVVCVSLAAQLVFLSKGIKPRRWIERRAAKQSARISLGIAVALVALLATIVYWQQV